MFQKRYNRYNRMVTAKATIQKIINAHGKKLNSIIDFLPIIEEEGIVDKQAIFYVLSKGVFMENIGFMMPSTKSVCKGMIIPKVFVLRDKYDLTLPSSTIDKGILVGDGGGVNYRVDKNGDILAEEKVDGTLIIKGGSKNE